MVSNGCISGRVPKLGTAAMIRSFVITHVTKRNGQSMGAYKKESEWRIFASIECKFEQVYFDMMI